MVALLDPEAPKPTKLERRIVSPSEVAESLPPKDTNQLSERNSAVEREQLRRGETREVTPPAPPPAPPPQPMQTPKQAAARMVRDAPPDARDNTETTPERSPPKLLLSDEALFAKLARPDRAKPRPNAVREALRGADAAKTDQERIASLESYEPFSRHSFSRLLAQGRSGDADYLPDIPDGDITLLNAKADRYAVFVRRVATQVFGALRRKSWSDLPLSEVRRIRGFATIEAVLSPRGKLLEVRLQEPSGSQPFDKTVVAAVDEGAWDQNPPEGARAADGNYHFIFKAKTWGRGVPNSPQQARWLLLGTGLK